MEKIRFKDLDGWLKFAAIGAIINSAILSLILFFFTIGMLEGLFA